MTGRAVELAFMLSGASIADSVTEDRRLLDLRRMRVIATSLLVAMAVVFVTTSFAQIQWEWLAYVRVDARLPSDVSAHADTIATAVGYSVLAAGRSTPG
jgi:hypothetical protein